MSAIDAAVGRRSVVIEETDAAQGLRDGMTIAIGGFINAAHPMALVRQLVRSGVRDLTNVGAEGLAPIGPAFRRAAQEGELDIFELDEAHFYAGLRAAAQRLPFNPWRAGVGTSYPEVNPRLRTFHDPIDGQ